MKKRFGVFALAAAAGCAVIFTGCSGCSSCNSSGKTNAAAFSSNWYADTSFRYIQPTFTEEGREEITYNVTLDGSLAGNTRYSVEYGAGTYTTVFYAKTLDKSLICEEFRGGYPDTMTVYYYKTELKIDSVTFKMKNDGGEETFTDGETTVTECYFMPVEKYLQPVYSRTEVDNRVPADYQPNSLESAYEHVSKTVTTSYNYGGTAAKTVTVDKLDGSKNSEKTVDGLDKTQNSLVDVYGLSTAVRAMPLSGGFTQVLSVFSTAGKMQDFTFTGSAGVLGDEERKTVTDKLIASNLYTEQYDEENNQKLVDTITVSASLNEDMHGVSQSYTFVAINNVKNNLGRATMVKASIPMPFSLGTVNYTLKEIVKTLY